MRRILQYAFALCLPLLHESPSFSQGPVFVPTGSIDDESGQAIVFYDGDAKASPFKISIGSWGGGACLEVTEPRYRGPKVLKVTTRGLYEGGRLEFQSAPPLAGRLDGAYLSLQMLISEPEKKGTEAFSGSRPDMPHMPREGKPSMPGAPAGPGMGPGDTKTTEKEEKKLEHLRVVLIFDQGVMVAERYPLLISRTDSNGWSSVAIPFAAFKSKGEVSGSLRRMAICGDRAQTFHIGRISFVYDTTPMRAHIRRVETGEMGDTETRVGREIELALQVDAGLAAVEGIWDFDATDGIGEDARGLRVVRSYAKPGSYTVTAVVKDLANQKSSVVTTFTVNVK